MKNHKRSQITSKVVRKTKPDVAVDTPALKSVEELDATLDTVAAVPSVVVPEANSDPQSVSEVELTPTVNAPPTKPPIVMQASTAKVYMDSLDRQMVRYEEYCGVNKHIVRDKMIQHQIKLWTTIKQGIVNTDMSEIDTYMDHLVKTFHKYKDGVLGEQRLYRYLIVQSTGKTIIDGYAIPLYSLFQIACERFDESRPQNMVDLNKAVADADTNVAEKVYAYFNKLGSDVMVPSK